MARPSAIEGCAGEAAFIDLDSAPAGRNNSLNFIPSLMLGMCGGRNLAYLQYCYAVQFYDRVS